jgi:hypothetical protein
VPANSKFVPIRTDVLTPVLAKCAAATAEHRVSGNPLAQPLAVSLGTDFNDSADPLMSKTNGERGEALLDVRHLAGIQLDIGATNADSFNFNDELPRSGNRVSKLVHLSDTG